MGGILRAIALLTSLLATGAAPPPNSSRLIARLAVSGSGLGTPFARDVRVEGAVPLFIQQKGEWSATDLPRLKSRFNLSTDQIPQLSAIYSGKSLGTFRVTGADGLLKLEPPTLKPLPEVERLAKEDKIILLSNLRAPKDPEGWTRTKITDTVFARASAEFIKAHPTRSECQEAEEGPDVLTRTEDPLEADDLFEMNRAFKNAKGDVLLGLAESDTPCANAPFDQPSWFVVRASGAVLSLKSVGTYLNPMDAADFDGDGLSEWIFVTHADDEPRFLLFNSKFELVAGSDALD